MAIKEFSDISANTAEHTKLTKEYVQWPQTQKRYQAEAEYKRLDDIANQRALQEKTILLRHSLVKEYMDALGQLAADEAVTYDKEMDNLGKATKEAKLVNAEEADVFSAVAKLLLKASTDAWRQDKLKDFVKTANPDIKVVIGGLKQIMDQGFIGDLDDEDIAVQKYYRAIVLESKDKAGIAAINEWRDVKLDSITNRRKAIKAYSLALEKISDAHEKLNNAINVNNITSKEFLGQMSRYAKDIQNAYNNIISLQG
ncbi:MAG: hypothetical protein V2B20_08060 [Pseudomonadota bacterium]